MLNSFKPSTKLHYTRRLTEVFHKNLATVIKTGILISLK